ncbi:preprotein translocase subunit SecA [Neptunomonas phycophila]|jgi:preprotein translocase subunit SecA|uniref:Protein translocase subunit SecA n=1 Tax=Neptunomonas phycophila TaxID=1572645 RepID=A0AAW7XMZ5_9GAMM|nr:MULTISPECIES: preprotein translocase subunit SecA [Neptunomonas]MDO6454684.1 preprotein translocase subunit SecA [Neptunomonas phycophila]MDO6467330.1 preprotein translocase subunit SecA [Neptunomonas phycophila]MDP2522107.1 preprotein translocase subunit SecA [Neptunomonas phycophila]
MLTSLVKKIFGSKNDRELKRMGKQVKLINALEDEISSLSDTDLQAKTHEFKERLAAGATLDDILNEAFAVAREASKRTLGLRHFDVQLIGGMTLHNGGVAEMRTGEGKTLVATLAVYLNALSGKGVHVVTVNDYLASRDAEWMRPLYEFLGMSVGVVLSRQQPEEKRAAYAADITYGTNNEFGFDYLRDNMAFSLDEKVQRDFNFAVVDEVDSILIDEARTPLIISGPAEDSSAMYKRINTLIPHLKRFDGEIDPKDADQEINEHFVVDEKNRTIELTEAGHQLIEEMLNKEGLLEEGESLYAPHNLNMLHHVLAGLRAHYLFQRDKDYIVQDNQVVIVDEHTGRIMPGRRWSEGLHQAVEAKENVEIQLESQTLASTTFQNYFRLYNNLSGMTGTADTEAVELRQIYGLDVIVIPTNRDIARKDYNDLIYLTMQEKYEAIIKEIRESQERKQPVLVGTASVESSELISQYLTKANIPHNVLNAKNHEREASIIANAGCPGAVTIATNMAGRGTDIQLGGKLELELEQIQDATDEKVAAARADWEKRHNQVLEAGGLYIIGTERHESRRIDNQLRGRAGRQGDPGASRFFLSLEDDLMRIFASDRVRGFMQALGMEQGEAIEHKMVTNAIEKAQRKVEQRNFDIRKSLLDYDDVANDQRTIIYEQRNELMASNDISETIQSIREDIVNTTVSNHIPPQSLEEQWDIPALERALEAEFAMTMPIQQWLDEDSTLHEESLRQKIQDQVAGVYAEKEALAGSETIRMFEKQVMLQVLDTLWKEHLQTMDHLRQGIHLRGYAQKNPKQEYKREAFELFQGLLENIKRDVIKVLSHVQVQQPEQVEEMEQQRREQASQQEMSYEHASDSGLNEDESQEQVATDEQNASVDTFVRDTPKVGRNDPCPCGSGKKYKQCHGKLS